MFCLAVSLYAVYCLKCSYICSSVHRRLVRVLAPIDSLSVSWPPWSRMCEWLIAVSWNIRTVMQGGIFSFIVLSLLIFCYRNERQLWFLNSNYKFYRAIKNVRTRWVLFRYYWMFLDASRNFGSRSYVAKAAFEYSLSLLSNQCKCVVTVV